MAKILHVSEFTKGGIETYLNEILRYQLALHDVHLLASEQNSNRDSLNIGAGRLHLYPYKRKPLFMLKAIRTMARAVKELEPDIVHIHGTFAGLFLRSALLLKRRRPAIIYCAHGWSFLMDTSPWKKRLYAGIEKLLAVRTDVIIHISRHEHDMAVRYGLPKEKSVIVYNGVSDVQVSTSPPFEPDPDRINLLFIGRFDPQKGFDLLLETFTEGRFRNVTLYLAGGTVLQDRHFDIPADAVKLGWIDNAEIASYIEVCDAVIVPSRWEGFGIVAIEALRGRKPVIASNRGALPEIVAHGINGYIFNFDDKEELATIIRGLDKARLKEMGEAGERIYRSRFHSDEMNFQIQRLYEAFAKGDGRRRDSPVVREYV
ncbi:glycosyl transferase [Paenibacillus sp. MY03]|uniref:Glycosyl transferase n=1 Tax=Paenibacillus agaridevorans TaxID=171404 RepID=A0A2R5EZ07_9BACL|nr:MULTISPECIES: glycosyltransferase [Paenibacillus]OUS75399.1 glycosyl transferase [Paenibacillus sp. MY03]GBG11942.1 glycosyl transferase [Paenibacillus agaridevorans]